MKIITLKLSLLAILNLVAFAQPQLQEIPKQLTNSRLGIKGYYGFVVTEIDSSVKQPEIGVGEVLISIEGDEQLTEIEGFQSRIRNMKQGSSVQAISLKFEEKNKTFAEREIRLNIFPTDDASRSKLGIKGVMAYIVTGIDSLVNQKTLNVGDFLTDTELDGQINNVLEFQKEIKLLGVDKDLRVIRMKFVSGKILNEEIKLKTYPYPEAKKVSNQEASDESCPRGACSWCCDSCPDSGQGNKFCLVSQCETGLTTCRLTPWKTCTFQYCV